MKRDFIISASGLHENAMLHLGEAIRDDLAAFAAGLDPLGISVKYNYEGGSGGDCALIFEIMKSRKGNGQDNDNGKMSCRVMVPELKMASYGEQNTDMNLVSNVSTTILRFLKDTLLTGEDLVKLDQNPESRWFIEYMRREMIPETSTVSSPSHYLL